MVECPLCDETFSGYQTLAEHLVRWHVSRVNSHSPAQRRYYPPGLIVYRKKRRARCWCGEVFSLVSPCRLGHFLFPADVPVMSKFALHLQGVGDLAQHILEQALGVDEQSEREGLTP